VDPPNPTLCYALVLPGRGRGGWLILPMLLYSASGRFCGPCTLPLRPREGGGVRGSGWFVSLGNRCFWADPEGRELDHKGNTKVNSADLKRPLPQIRQHLTAATGPLESPHQHFAAGGTSAGLAAGSTSAGPSFTEGAGEHPP
jgi:hypothetical protein